MSSVEKELLFVVHTTDEPLTMKETLALADAAALLAKYPSLAEKFASILSK